MPILAVSVRRPLGLLAVVLLGCLLAVALLQSQAEGRGQKCPEGAEKAGCKLPVNAAYSAKVKDRSAEGLVTATVVSGGVRVHITDVWIDCKKFDPSNGDESGVLDDYTGKQRPKVGKTYLIKKSETQNSEGTSSSADSGVTLQFKTAKQLVVTLHQVSMVEGKVLCDGSGTWTLKRQ